MNIADTSKVDLYIYKSLNVDTHVYRAMQIKIIRNYKSTKTGYTI